MLDHARAQAFLRALPSAGRTVLAVPPFTLFLDPDDGLKYFNYAIPDGDVEPDAATLGALRAAFAAHERLPRLEWLEETAPRLAPALARDGFVEELRSPLMACGAEGLVAASTTVPIEGLTVAPLADEQVAALAALQGRAFGHEVQPGSPLSDPRTRGGGAVVAAVHGTPVAAAIWTRVVDGVAEIVGVATEASWRRRGLAGVVTAGATAAAFAAGAALCVLSPGDDTAQRVYARAGFVPTATMLHWSAPEG